MASVYERVKKVTVTSLGVTDNEVHPDSTFAADLGADSLDQVELMMALEEEFSTRDKKITIPDEESEKMTNVQDVVDFLHGIGVSDVQAPPKSAEKGGFPKINLPRPSFSRQGQPKDRQAQNKQGGASQQRGGRRRDNRQRQDRQQNVQRPANPKGQQPPRQQPKPGTNNTAA